MNRKLIVKLIFIACLIPFAVHYIGGWEGKNVKGGIDLMGGTSLLYEIDTTGVEGTYGAAEEMIPVLRKRVDPDSVRNLVWRAVGNTRIEILMPLPTEANQRISQEYSRKVEALEAKNIKLTDVHAVLNIKDSAEQDQAWEEFLAKYPDYLLRLNAYRIVHDELIKAHKAFQINPASDAAQAKWGQALLKMDRTRQYLKDMDIGREEIESILGLAGRFGTPAFVNKLADFPSTYDGEIERLNSHGPQRKQREKEKDKYVWLDDSDLEFHVGTQGQNAHFESVEKQREAQVKAGKNPIVVTSAFDGRQYMLAYSSGSRRAVSLDRMLKNHPSRGKEIRDLVGIFDQWSGVRGQLDDPASLKRLLRGQGVLEFAILSQVDPKSPLPEEVQKEITRLNNDGAELQARLAEAGTTEDYAWFEINDPEGFSEGMVNRGVIIRQSELDGKTYVLADIRKGKRMFAERDAGGNRIWQLAKAQIGRDSYGAPAVNFDFNSAGGRIFEDLTRDNRGKFLAIILDDVIYSAPSIRTIIRGTGQITGRYSLEEARQLANTLNAGSLLANLLPDPIREYTIGPSMGKDNRDRGTQACIYGLMAVAAFMVVYYLLAGVVANVALFMNLLFVLGIMSGISATFTLPGIAGLILTVGMSVDANVLIFERIREEFNQGNTLRMSIQNGYRKAFWTIFDANLTTMITALILYWVGSEQVRGFAIVLGYGIAMSMFTALFVTRTIFDALLELGWLKKLPMLHLIGRPTIDWMAKRKTFYIISVVLVIGGVILFAGRSSTIIAPSRNLYDIEFAGGTSVWFRLMEPAADGEVRQAIVEAGREMGDELIAGSSVYAINPSGDERKSTDFKLDTAQTDSGTVEKAIEKAFAGRLVEQQPVEFDVVGQPRHPEGLVPVLEEDVLVGNTPIDLQLVDYIGGLKLTLENLRSPQKLQDIRERIRAARLEPESGDKQDSKKYRKFEVFGLKEAEGSEGDADGKVYSSVVIAVADPAYKYSSAGADTWRGKFAAQELKLVTNAMDKENRFQAVTKFNPEVAAEAKVKAVFAIVLAMLAIVGYVWMRFGKGRYGLAAIVALAHDVFAVLGLVALATFIYNTPLGRLLGVSDLKIDMTMVAAVLTIIGYSLNDTIVVFDRIRENRGRLADISPTIVNNSINQTMSRTLLTSGTTLLAVLIMYIWGGPGIHGFTSAMILGVVVGTYSSIAIASPTVLLIGKLWQAWTVRSEAKAAAARHSGGSGRK